MPPARQTCVLPGWDAIYARSLDCVHCGLCLESCPTYRETRSEVSSPRGRIYLMRAVAEGRMPLAGVASDEAYLCLGCRACETACPSGVEYGAMLEQVRREIERAGLRRGPARWLERRALRDLLAHPRRLARVFEALAWVERLRIDRLLLPLLPAALRDARALAPRVPPRAERAPLPVQVPAQGVRRARVGFLSGCIMPQLFGAVNAATTRVLSANGFEVVVPREQHCCGALQAHAGDAECAHALARYNARVFDQAGVDVVIVNSAGCGAAMRDAAGWLQAEGYASGTVVRDVSEWLDAEGLRAPLGRLEARVCYDDPCHLLHGQKVSAAPRRLLAQIPGLELVSHEDPGACCGAAGIYNLTHPAMATAVLERKLRSLAAVDPDLIASGNPGCMMQLAAGVRRAGLRASVVHPVELLDAAQRAATA
jgi:glycolate dehydrogenase iron-sulfur subunit